jgi:hypothetical protein
MEIARDLIWIIQMRKAIASGSSGRMDHQRGGHSQIALPSVSLAAARPEFRRTLEEGKRNEIYEYEYYS